MHQHLADVVRLLRVEPGHDALEVRHVVGARRAEAPRPALDLASDVARAAPEVLQAGRRHVDGVQVGEGVDEPLAERLRARRVVEPQLRGHLAPDDVAGHPAHDVELRAEHRRVVAQAEHLRHLREDRRERRLHAVLAPHVVRRRGLLPRGRHAQHEVLVGVAQQEREVGRARAELPDLRRRLRQLGAPPAQPGVRGRDVEGVLGPHRRHLVDGHALLLRGGPAWAGRPYPGAP